MGLVLVVVLAAPAHAGNGTVTRSADGTEIRLTFTDAVDSLLITSTGDPITGSVILDENQSNATTITPAVDSGCTPSNDEAVCPRIHNGKAATRFVVDFQGGEDADEVTTFQWQTVLVVLGGAGDDVALWGSEGGDVLDGGPGADSIDGFRGADSLIGGAGDDVLTGYESGDDYAGGDGLDTVVMTNRDFPSDGVTVTLDDQPNDGVAGGAEGDNVHSDVEEVVGTANADHMTGGAGSDVLVGRGGSDTLDGAGGNDHIQAGDGDDTIFARDGKPERIECGPGEDTATVDDIDELDGCEQVAAATVLAPRIDADADGSPRPDDCDDRSPAVRPGAGEIPDNGIDENCDGGDATTADRDGDGAPRPFDCDDTDRSARPGGVEVPGNRIDEDCNGFADPYPQIRSRVVSDFRRSAGRIRVRSLNVRDLVAGTTVELRCRGRGCPLRARRRVVTKATRRLDLLPLVRRARLSRGARLEVWITRRATVGQVVRIPIPRRGLPEPQTLCLDPGAKVPTAC